MAEKWVVVRGQDQGVWNWVKAAVTQTGENVESHPLVLAGPCHGHHVVTAPVLPPTAQQSDSLDNANPLVRYFPAKTSWTRRGNYCLTGREEGGKEA